MPSVSGGGRPKTLVLWDIEDCPVPDSLDPYTVWQKICSALWDKGYVQGRFEAIGFGDIFQTESNFGGAGIGISHVPKAIGADYDTNFVFLRALSHLKSRTSNHVILAQPAVVSRKLKLVVSSAWLWSSLSARGDPFFHQTKTTRPMICNEGHYITANAAIFWDVKDCQIPDGLNAAVVLQNIRSALANCGIVSIDEVVPIYAYGDTMNHFQGLESLDIVHKLSPSGLDKDARLEKILVDFFCCLIDKPDTTNLMLILGDISGHGLFFS